MLKKQEIKLGQLLIERQWCSLSQITEVLDFQNELRAKNQTRALGMLLVQTGALQEEQLVRALYELGVLTFCCAGCERQYRIARLVPDHSYRCPVCGGELGVGDPPADLHGLPLYSPEGEGREVGAPGDAPLTGAERSGAPGALTNGNERDPYVGKVLGGCQLIERIAKGGMGVVYKARQLNLNRPVAVKILADDLSRDASFVRRFLAEARAAAQLNHGSIVHINDVGEFQGTFFFTMELVEGQTLKALLGESGALPIERALDIALQVCHALRHAHQRGFVHRDIKPENIMLTADGVVKVADLGLAKRLVPSGDSDLTRVGSILGTPFYMAPEQVKDFSNVDNRSDIYSLGVTIFKMITGEVPFDGRSPIEVMVQVIEGKRPPMSAMRPDVPAEIERIVDRMMERDPARRYQSIDEVIDSIQDVLADVSEPEPAMGTPRPD